MQSSDYESLGWEFAFSILSPIKIGLSPWLCYDRILDTFVKKVNTWLQTVYVCQNVSQKSRVSWSADQGFGRGNLPRFGIFGDRKNCHPRLSSRALVNIEGNSGEIKESCSCNVQRIRPAQTLGWLEPYHQTIEAGDNVELSLLRGFYDLRRGWVSSQQLISSPSGSLSCTYCLT
jgi:hypothetical protein